MARLMVGGAFLGSFLNVVFDRLASPEFVNLIHGKKLDSKLIRRLETTLRVVRAALNDAEKKQIRDPDVNYWLNDLKDDVYVTDDLLDEISTKAVLNDAEKKQFRDSDVNNWLNDGEMVSKLEDIVERLEYVLKLKESLDLKENAVENSSYKIPSTSLQDESHVYGRDKDKEAIIKLLLGDNGDGEEVSVIPIVGMGGVGKTTLAQLVYNDDSLMNVFDVKAWACVSEEFDILRVTKIITQAVTGSTCEMNDLNLLHLGLQGRLKEKKFLIVLDDVWIEDYVNWDLLKKPIQRGVKGSKILVTTRSEKVASVVQTVQTYNLNQLSNEDCWLVFADHACFSPGSSGNTTALEKIGRKIVKKCAGLPLAAQSLGGILRRKHDIRDWNNLLKSDIWELSESDSKIIPALRVSYHYLPPHLKRCFVYCSLYPKDYEFMKNDLILLWMAEDLLSPPRKGKTLEEVGGEYLDYLVARSFLQRSSGPWGESFVMHDLLHDLATFLGGEFYHRSEDRGVETKISIKTRHLSFTKFSGLLENFKVPGTANFLRTFLPMRDEFDESNDEGKAACTVLSKLKHLRVLSFWGFGGLNAVPDFIGKLIHLRYLDLMETSIMALPESLGNLYNLQTLKLCGCDKLIVLPSSMQNLVNLLYLDLSGTSIMALPESLGNLYNLQTLKLSGCYELIVLPNGMQNLVNLHHLDNANTALKEMPKGMGKLTQLQHLRHYIVGKQNGIKELGGLSNLHGSLSIAKLENVGNGSEASKAKIMDKKYISHLLLTWSSANNCCDSQTEMDILCNLQPHQDLQLLEIKGYRGTRFPDWVGNSSFHNMTDITLSSCKNCRMLPSLGQLPSLKKLRIAYMYALVTIDAGFYKNNDSSLLTPFPILESLEFENMSCWEVWSPIEPSTFPKLKILVIENCPKLRGDLPSHLPALERLTIMSCTELASSLPRAPVIRSLKIVKSYKVALQELPLSMDSSYMISLFPKQHTYKLLEKLSIVNCGDSLTSLPSEMFPNLKDLYIGYCKNLESLSASPECAVQNLSSLDIRGCPNFVSFPREGLHAPSLTRFRVSDCDKLKSLPQQMNTLLPKLENLCISNCPEIESFPEGGMPPSLRSIFIWNCEKILSGPAWPSMDMLSEVTIWGPCDGIKSFPKEGLLPSSLTFLKLLRFSSLETLDCKGLLHLTSLQELAIARCPKLENIAGERLPASLTKLGIDTALKEMPHGMRKLTQLQHLNYYIVGKHEENGIKELGGLSNLHGSLSIKELENVSNGSEALEAKMVDKKHISQLSLHWSSADNCFDSQTEMDILCKLQPHQDLQLLKIDGYRGTRFPDWVRNPSFHIMTDITLYSCKNCCMLPSLGQLPSLKKLRISCLDLLVTIDAGFYKNNDSSLLTPFPFLKYLEFKDMPCWEVWSPIEPDAFPKLKCLKIENCPKLRGDLPSHLRALEELNIRNCMELASSLPKASALHSLQILGSNKVALQELPLSIETLDIARSPMDCSYAISLFAGGCLPESLKKLHILDVRRFEFPKKHKHKSLESLEIDNSCDSLTSLPLETFPNLKDLLIANCENLESLSASQDCALRNLSSLEIHKCPNFASFPREGLHAPSLTCFRVSNCDKLKSLPQQMNTLLPKLDDLSISYCPEIESFPEGGMPPSLRSIFIINCEKLLSGPAWPSMDMLSEVTIWGPCDGIKSFPKEGLLPSSLTSLKLVRFSSLETLDCKGLLHLTSLQELAIARCPKLENIAGERLPASLTYLPISACPLLEERCCQKHPQVWPKISHVNVIEVDGKQIS